ncbi:hypothetical protein SDC9_195043 [bioreactor metagenome]|uniref:Uncharacterized protein n=1 Tax=bioreactor metagenome TaxID=1076179 RepID=A0A645I7Y5_9ZZZZ
MYRATHHVFADAGTGAAGNGDGGGLVHAAGVVAGMADDFDVDRAVETDRDVVSAVRIDDGHGLHLACLGIGVQKGVELTQRSGGEIESQAFHTYISSGAGSNTWACFTPGRWASDRNSDAMAT